VRLRGLVCFITHLPCPLCHRIIVPLKMRLKRACATKAGQDPDDHYQITRVHMGVPSNRSLNTIQIRVKTAEDEGASRNACAKRFFCRKYNLKFDDVWSVRCVWEIYKIAVTWLFVLSADLAT